MTTSRSQVQHQIFQYPPIPTYRSMIHTAAGQLSDEDDIKLRTAVATGTNFQDIKDIMFSDRFDLSPRILENRARELGAEWPPARNVALLDSLELPLKIGEDYNLRSPSTEAYTAVNPAYQTPNTSSSQPGTASQSLVGPSSRLPRGYDNPQAVSEPVLGYASGGSKPGSSVAGRGQVESHFDIQWTDQNLDVIKVKMARCYTLADIARGFRLTPRRKAKDIESILTKIGYEEWSDEQDNHLLKLQQDIGDNWAEIRKRLSGPERKEAEIQGRLKDLSERPPNLNKQRHVILYNLEKRAKKIGATWSEDDNQKLRDKVLGYEDDLEVDWGSIVEKYNPPRRAEAVQIRWRHLRGVL
ncbi:hypothetical protein LA080_001523 [Diaporthe eres]|nr:hypothetical protein LA080_001523 [Diaporthe eres]